MTSTSESTLVVELCERLDDLAMELVQRLSMKPSSSPTLEQVCSKKIASGDLKGLVEALLGPVTDITPTQQHPIHPEIAFSLFLVLLKRLPGERQYEVVQRVCEGLTKTREEIGTRARCLTSLFNGLPKRSDARFVVFKTLVEFVGDKSVITEGLDAEKVKGLCEGWGEGDEEKVRALQLAIADAYKVQAPVKSQKALLAYLATFKTKEEADKANLLRVKECAINVVRDPVASSKDFNALNSQAILRLKRDDPTLHELLDIVCGDSLDRYAQFHQKHPEFEKSLNIDHDKTFEKMRLLALAALGSESDRALSYEEVAKALRVQPSEVEGWVIKAIGSGVVDAKMDQVNRSVVVYRATHRAFTDDQWIRMSLQLKKWRASVRNVLQTVQSAQVMVSGAQPIQQ